MTRPQSFTLPAAVMVCILITWIGTMAVASMPAVTTVSSMGGSEIKPRDSVSVNQTQMDSQAASNTGESTCSLGAKYPESVIHWCGLIEQYARENDLQANLVAALILQESGGNPQAYSSAGAVGLMQVMPRDGLAAAFQCPSGPCFTRRPTMAQLFDPEFNISYGTEMLAGLILKFGSIREGLKYYGPSGIGYRYADIVLTIQANYR